MRLLYFGTICNKENYMAMRENFRVKPSMAPFVFETALLQGMAQTGAQVDAISFPVIPAFPKSKHLFWGNREQTLESGYKTTWIRAVNLSGLKQLCQRWSSAKLLKRWLKANAGEEKAVLLYSAYAPVAKSIVKNCKKYSAKCYCIIPDLPRDMYAVAKINPVKKFLSRFYVRSAQKVQGQFDGYIYLTEAMKEVINPDAPYTVVEGIANVAEARTLTPEDKAPGKVVMYAGALSEKLGLGNLVEAFLQADVPESQLWLFGDGDFRPKAEAYAKQDSRIQYFGSVDRQTVLQREKQATLLVNVRDGSDSFTRYSFPSKVIEYMLSGTPMFMTKLPGIPEEYYGYTYAVDDNRVQTLKEGLRQVLNRTPEELMAFGSKAQDFIREHKNARAQAQKIRAFMEENNGKNIIDNGQ